MPTWATVAKGLTEAGVLVAVFVPFVKWIVEKILAQHKDHMAQMLVAMREDRESHTQEVDHMLDRYDMLNTTQLRDHAEILESQRNEHARTRDHIDIAAAKFAGNSRG